jgi:PAB1-binding protein PBP1
VNTSENIFFGNLEEDTSKWDQFELNKKKFNVNTTYDEKHYTTELDHEAIPMQVKHNAEKIVKDILENPIYDDNIHLREERGLIDQCDGDEEDKYSSVVRIDTNATTDNNINLNSNSTSINLNGK